MGGLLSLAPAAKVAAQCPLVPLIAKSGATVMVELLTLKAIAPTGGVYSILCWHFFDLLAGIFV